MHYPDFRSSVVNADRHVATLLRLIAREVRRDDPQHVITFRQLGSVPDAARYMSTANGVCYFVKEPRGLAAIDGDPALIRVRNLRRFPITRQSIEKDIDSRLLESRRRCPIIFKNLVTELIQPEAAPIGIHVRAIERVNYDPYRPTHQQSFPLFLLHAWPIRVEQLNAVLLDSRRNIVFESNRHERERIDLTARWTNVHMNVIHLVDGANSIAGTETCATSDSHSFQFTFTVVHRNKS